MKKLIIAVLSVVFILGAGTFAFAQTNADKDKELNFEQMQPYMQEMHPDWSTEEQKAMYDSCHSEGGMMENYNSENTNAQN